ncbi:phage tail fiber repeat protein, partial [Haemophilus influenzae]
KLHPKQQKILCSK